MSGVDGIIEMINRKTEQRVNEILQKAKDTRAKKIEQAKADAQRRVEEIEAAARREAQNEARRREAGARLRAKRRILEAKNEMIQSVMESLEERLVTLPESDRYEDILLRFIVEGAEALGLDELELVIPEGHQKYVNLQAAAKAIKKATGRSVRLTVSDESVRSKGGVIIRSKDGRKWVDNTFEARLERMGPAIRDAVAMRLFGPS